MYDINFLFDFMCHILYLSVVFQLHKLNTDVKQRETMCFIYQQIRIIL